MGPLLVVVGVISKRDALSYMLEDGPVLVFVDVSFSGVVVPPEHSEGRWAFRFGYDLHPPIPDMALTVDALMGTLHFKGKPFQCHIPWPAVFAIRVEGNNHQVTWTDEVEIDIQIEAEPQPKPRHLKLVD